MRADKLNTKKQPSEPAAIASTEFALGVACSMIVMVLVWLISSAFSVAYTQAELLDLLPSTMTLLVATISLYFSFHGLREQQRARQAGTDPVIFVHLGQREDAPLLIMLHVSNVGAGAAINVRLQFEDDVVRSAYAAEKTIADLSKIKTPIRVIPQDSRVSYSLHTFPVLNSEPSLPELEVIVTYEDVDGGQYSSKQSINIQEMKEQSAQETPIAIIANSMKKMHKSIEKITADNQEFFVVTQDVERYRDEKKKQDEELMAMLKAHKETEGM